MSKTDRIEVLCAARLEGPGVVGYQSLKLLGVALSRSGEIEVFARLTSGGYWHSEPLWELKQSFKTPQEASETIKLLAEQPRFVFPQGRLRVKQEQREVDLPCICGERFQVYAACSSNWKRADEVERRMAADGTVEAVDERPIAAVASVRLRKTVRQVDEFGLQRLVLLDHGVIEAVFPSSTSKSGCRSSSSAW